LAIEIVDPDARWPADFEEIAARLRASFGAKAMSIDHIGSTAVPGLPAKPIIDVQVTVLDFDGAREALEASGFEMAPYTHDHRPPGTDLAVNELEKRTASAREPIPANVHVRIAGHFNQRYPLLFRDYLRATPAAAAAYAEIKRALARIVVDDRDAYYDVKDPVCDLIMAAAELWAADNDWRPRDPYTRQRERAGRS
jgi:GrpB-like predicted nucleotidyltransferase (UPF0157 family)